MMRLSNENYTLAGNNLSANKVCDGGYNNAGI